MHYISVCIFSTLLSLLSLLSASPAGPAVDPNKPVDSDFIHAPLIAQVRKPATEDAVNSTISELQEAEWHIRLIAAFSEPPTMDLRGEDGLIKALSTAVNTRDPNRLIRGDYPNPDKGFKKSTADGSYLGVKGYLTGVLWMDIQQSLPLLERLVRRVPTEGGPGNMRFQFVIINESGFAAWGEMGKVPSGENAENWEWEGAEEIMDERSATTF